METLLGETVIHRMANVRDVREERGWWRRKMPFIRAYMARHRWCNGRLQCLGPVLLFTYGAYLDVLKWIDKITTNIRRRDREKWRISILLYLDSSSLLLLLFSLPLNETICIVVKGGWIRLMNFKEIYADTVGIKKLNDWFKLEKWRLINLWSSKGGRKRSMSYEESH